MKQISNHPDKEFKVMVIKILTKLRRGMEEHSENYNKEIEYILKGIKAKDYNNQNKKYTRGNQ